MVTTEIYVCHGGPGSTVSSKLEGKSIKISRLPCKVQTTITVTPGALSPFDLCMHKLPIPEHSDTNPLSNANLL